MGKQAALIYCVLLSVFCDILCAVPFFVRDSAEDGESDIKVNSSVNPCDNFYEFSCSNWTSRAQQPNYNPFLNHFTAAAYEINKNIQRILEVPSNDIYLEKALTFYNACTEAGFKDDTYFTDIKLLIEFFKGWPLASTKWRNQDFHWLEEITQVTKILGLHPILKIHVAVDYKDTYRYAIYIEPGNLIFPHSILVHPERYQTEMLAYNQWILKTVLHLYPEKSVPKSLKLQVSKLIDFEKGLAKLFPPVSRIEKISIDRLSKKSSVDFKKYLANLFSDTDIHINQSTSVIVKNYGYLRNLLQFLKNMDSKVVSNYIMWTVVKDLSRDSTKYLRNLNFAVDKTIFKETSDTPRKMECVSKTMDYFSYALLPKYLESYFDNKSLEAVISMADNIQEEFTKVLRKNSWLSENTKLLAIEKVKNIKFFIGYSEFMKNRDTIYEMYKDLKITDDHLQNVLTLKNFRAEKNLKLLDKKVSPGIWPSNVFDVNAYYSVLQNSVFIPLGLIQAPFYNESRFSVENYGSIGSLIGHEISHSLDATGRQANLQGIISKWWPNQDVSEYHSKAKCFEDLYKSQNIFNLGENIADVVGLEISYNAFQNSELEALLAGKNQLDKMFFVSYAQMWCERKSEYSVILNDEHTLVETRVNKVVSNNIDFRNAFACPEISTGKICRLW